MIKIFKTLGVDMSTVQDKPQESMVSNWVEEVNHSDEMPTKEVEQKASGTNVWNKSSGARKEEFQRADRPMRRRDQEARREPRTDRRDDRRGDRRDDRRTDRRTESNSEFRSEHKSVCDFDYTVVGGWETKKVSDLSSEDLLKMIIVRGHREKNPVLWKGGEGLLKQINGERFRPDGERRFGRGMSHGPSHDESAPEMKSASTMMDGDEAPAGRERRPPRRRRARPHRREEEQEAESSVPASNSA